MGLNAPRPTVEIVYVAFGRRFIREAAISAASAKRQMPKIWISLVTDQNISSPLFNKIRIVKSCPAGEDPVRFAKFHKATAILDSAAERVLYLDADTYIAADLTEVFSVLDHCDIACAHDTWRMAGVYQKLHPAMKLPEEPCWKTYFNTGVLLIKKTPLVESFVRNWIDSFIADPRLQREQIVFQRLIYDSGTRVHVLPTEMNVRASEPVQISGPVLILHRLCNFSAVPDWPSSSALLCDFLNTWTTNRVFTPHDGRLVILTADFQLEERYLSEHTSTTEKEEYIIPDVTFN